MTFLQYWLKIKWLWYNPNKKSRKKQLLSSVHAVCIQLRELHSLFKETLRLSLSPFSRFKILFLCGATSQPRIKRTPQSIGTKVSLIIYFFLSATNQHFVFFFFHLWQRYSLDVLCILLLIFVTMDNVERDTNSFWEDYINPFARKNETKCVKIIPRFSVYLPIHN